LSKTSGSEGQTKELRGGEIVGTVPFWGKFLEGKKIGIEERVERGGKYIGGGKMGCTKWERGRKPLRKKKDNTREKRERTRRKRGS